MLSKIIDRESEVTRNLKITGIKCDVTRNLSSVHSISKFDILKLQQSQENTSHIYVYVLKGLFNVTIDLMESL